MDNKSVALLVCSVFREHRIMAKTSLMPMGMGTEVCSGCGQPHLPVQRWDDEEGGSYCNACQVIRFREEGGWDLTMPKLLCDHCSKRYPPKLLTVGAEHKTICSLCHRSGLARDHGEVICSCRRWLPLTIVWTAVLALLFSPMTMTQWAPLVAVLAMPLPLLLVIRLSLALKKKPILPWILLGFLPWIGMFPLGILVHQASRALRRSGIMATTGQQLLEQRGDPLDEHDRSIYASALDWSHSCLGIISSLAVLLLMGIGATSPTRWALVPVLGGPCIDLMAFIGVLYYRAKIRRFYGAGIGEFAKGDACALYEQWLFEPEEEPGTRHPPQGLNGQGDDDGRTDCLIREDPDGLGNVQDMSKSGGKHAQGVPEVREFTGTGPPPQ